MSRWFRFYDDALDDPKVQRLPGDLFKTWVNVLCLASKNAGTLPPVEDMAFALRLSEREAEKQLDRLKQAGLLDEVDALQGTLRPHNWNVRQFRSDGSTERVKRFRERSRNVPETPRATGPDTDTESDTETEAEKESGGGSAQAREDELEAKPKPIRPFAKLYRECHFAATDTPLCIATDFTLAVDMAEKHGLTHDDFRKGLADALAEGFALRARSWRQIVGWARRAAQDRLEATAPTPSGRRESRSTNAYSRIAVRLKRAAELKEAPHGEDFSDDSGPLPDFTVVEGGRA